MPRLKHVCVLCVIAVAGCDKPEIAAPSEPSKSTRQAVADAERAQRAAEQGRAAREWEAEKANIKAPSAAAWSAVWNEMRTRQGVLPHYCRAVTSEMFVGTRVSTKTLFHIPDVMWNTLERQKRQQLVIGCAVLSETSTWELVVGRVNADGDVMYDKVMASSSDFNRSRTDYPDWRW